MIPTAYHHHVRGLRDRQAFEGIRMQTGVLVFLGTYLIDWFRIVPRIGFNSQSYLPVKWPEYQDLAFPAGESTEVKEQGSHMESPGSKN
jgi:hypothetical protein